MSYKHLIGRQIIRKMIELVSILFLFAGFLATLFVVLHMIFRQEHFLKGVRYDLNDGFSSKPSFYNFRDLEIYVYISD